MQQDGEKLHVHERHVLNDPSSKVRAAMATCARLQAAGRERERAKERASIWRHVKWINSRVGVVASDEGMFGLRVSEEGFDLCCAVRTAAATLTKCCK